MQRDRRSLLVSAASLLPISAPHSYPDLPETRPSKSAPPDVICLLDSSSDIEEVPGALHDHDVIVLSSDSEDSEEQDTRKDDDDTQRPMSDLRLLRQGTLSDEQQHIFDMVIHQRKNVFFTGSAG
jgi:hypothetical protein